MAWEVLLETRKWEDESVTWRNWVLVWALMRAQNLERMKKVIYRGIELASTGLNVGNWPFFLWKNSESESGSVMPDSLWPWDYAVHGMLQARILEWIAIPFSKDLPNPGICLHCWWILYQLNYQGSPWKNSSALQTFQAWWNQLCETFLWRWERD